ncbi:hypothetical protein BH11PLA2_BH11PLA2_12400 [soil metagenome]
MNIWYPQFSDKQFRTVIRIALLGAVIGGLYGMIHDQISYTISSEYFTKLKFRQFSYANFGWHPRIFAAEVGLIACSGVGLIVGWFLARAGLADLPTAKRGLAIVRSFALVFGITVIVEVIGAAIGVNVVNTSDLQDWSEWQRGFNLQNLPGFVIVVYLHNAAYIGGTIGTIAAVVYVRRLKVVPSLTNL